MSDEAERRIFELLGRPVESPYGTPIPGLDEFGAERAAPFLEGVSSLEAAVADARGDDTPERRFRIRRLGEPVQADGESLAVLREAGMLPGSTVSVRADGDTLVLRACDRPDAVDVYVGREISEHVYVSDANGIGAVDAT